jgi:hypothetical protein
MLLFPVWLLQILIIGGLVLCGAGAVALLIFLILDKRSKQIW